MTSSPRRALLGAGVALASVALIAGAVVPASAASPRPASSHIALPDGFPPEALAIDHGTAYLGSRADGDILALDLRTGRSRVVSEGPGTQSLGVALDSRRHLLYVAGGEAGDARVVDLRTGAVLAEYQLVPEGTPAFINDVLLTDRGAVFTDSVHDTLYRVDGDTVENIPLSGEWVETPEYNANGITTSPDERAMLVVNSTTGELYRVEHDGTATRADLGGTVFSHPDGIFREGRTLYVVQNAIDAIAVVELDRTGTSGRVVDTITSDDFDVPTAIARSGDRLYVTNARFGVPEEPGTPYWLTSLQRGARHGGGGWRP